MNDEKIIDLLFARDEKALRLIEQKYGALCRYIASNILEQREDVEECVSDVMLALWNAIPPDRPDDLRSYIGRFVRNRALVISRDTNAWKRGGRITVVGEEYLCDAFCRRRKVNEEIRLGGFLLFYYISPLVWCAANFFAGCCMPTQPSRKREGVMGCEP